MGIKLLHPLLFPSLPGKLELSFLCLPVSYFPQPICMGVVSFPVCRSPLFPFSMWIISLNLFAYWDYCFCCTFVVLSPLCWLFLWLSSPIGIIVFCCSRSLVNYFLELSSLPLSGLLLPVDYLLFFWCVFGLLRY